MTGIMDHRPRKIINRPQRKKAGLKEPKEIEVVNSWALYEIESKQELAKEAQSNELSE